MPGIKNAAYQQPKKQYMGPLKTMLWKNGRKSLKKHSKIRCKETEISIQIRNCVHGKREQKTRIADEDSACPTSSSAANAFIFVS